jgi:hypothetical protein
VVGRVCLRILIGGFCLTKYYVSLGAVVELSDQVVEDFDHEAIVALLLESSDQEFFLERVED